MFYAIIEAAKNRDMKVTGHMPMNAYFKKAIEKGIDGTEHMYYLIKACSSMEDSLTALHQGYAVMPEIIESYDETRAKQVFQYMVDNNVFVTPTLFIGKTLANLTIEDHSDDSLLQYIGDGIKATYKDRIESAKRARARGNLTRQVMNEHAMDMILPMQEAGVSMLAGSDCGAYNSFVYPGGGLHGELMTLVKAGLTPRQALITSMVNGPRFFEIESKYCNVASGKYADLIILDKNPLINIENVQKIDAVIARGRLHSYQQLIKKLKRYH